MPSLKIPSLTGEECIAQNDVCRAGQLGRRIYRPDKCRPSGKARSLPKRPTRRHCSAPFQPPLAPKTNTTNIGKAALHGTLTRLLIIYFALAGSRQIPQSSLRAQKDFRSRSFYSDCELSEFQAAPLLFHNLNLWMPRRCFFFTSTARNGKNTTPYRSLCLGCGTSISVRFKLRTNYFPIGIFNNFRISRKSIKTFYTNTSKWASF